MRCRQPAFYGSIPAPDDDDIIMRGFGAHYDEISRYPLHQVTGHHHRVTQNSKRIGLMDICYAALSDIAPQDGLPLAPAMLKARFDAAGNVREERKMAWRAAPSAARLENIAPRLSIFSSKDKRTFITILMA